MVALDGGDVGPPVGVAQPHADEVAEGVDRFGIVGRDARLAQRDRLQRRRAGEGNVASVVW